MKALIEALNSWRIVVGHEGSLDACGSEIIKPFYNSGIGIRNLVGRQGVVDINKDGANTDRKQKFGCDVAEFIEHVIG